MSVETRNWQWRNQRKSQQHRFASYCKFNTYVRELFKIQNSNINTLICLDSLVVRFRSEESLTHAGIPGNRSASSNISSLKGDKRNMDKKTTISRAITPLPLCETKYYVRLVSFLLSLKVALRESLKASNVTDVTKVQRNFWGNKNKDV